MWVVALGCVICAVLVSLPLLSAPLAGRKGVLTPSVRYEVSGRVILAAVETGEQRIFRFFNDIRGKVEFAKGVGSVEATGLVHVPLGSLPMRLYAERLPTQSSAVRRMLAEGGAPVASIKFENLTGLRDHEIAVGNQTLGRLLGKVRVLGLVDEIDVAVRITRYDEKTYVIEPIEGLTYSLDELGIADEVAMFIEADPDMLEDFLRFYFKFILRPVEQESR